MNYTFYSEDDGNIQKLQALQKAVLPLIIIGEQQSGRNTLAQYYSHIVSGRPPIGLSLQNAQDVRDIYGQYTCGNIPGRFVFHEGILLMAIRTGRCVLIKNAEQLQVDIFSALCPLIERLSSGSHILTVQNNQVVIHPNFRLILTCSPQARLLKMDFIDKFFEIRTHAFSNEKVRSIIKEKLNGVPFDTLMLQLLYDNGKITLTQVCKIIKRLVYDVDHKIIVLNDQYQKTQEMNALTQQTRYYIIQEIYDAWLMEFSDQKQRQDQIDYLMRFFQLDCVQVENYLTKTRFDVKFDRNLHQITIGRYTVPQFAHEAQEQPLLPSQLKNFALTDYTTRLMQQIVSCIVNNENLLLISSTGIGKTYTLEMVSRFLNNKLLVINFSAQTEISDLLGGYKPINMSLLTRQIYDLGTRLLKDTLDLAVESNQAFYTGIVQDQQDEKYGQVVRKLKMFINQYSKSQQAQHSMHADKLAQLLRLIQQYTEFHSQKQRFFFKYQDGILLEAAKNGYFILFDEINLAPNEILEFLHSFLSNQEITINDQNYNYDIAIQKHKNFRVFASMNPATDAGKKRLPRALEDQFTCMYLSEMDNYNDLLQLARTYMDGINIQTGCQNVVELFQDLKHLQGRVQTTTGQAVVYSIRLFCRAMRFAQWHPHIRRSLYDGFHLYFTGSLDQASYQQVIQAIKQKIIDPNDGDFRPQLSRLPFLYQGALLHVINNIYFPAGPMYRNGTFNERQSILEGQRSFIVTETNRQYINIIIKALLNKTAVLLEGVTSSGKSSLVLFLAAQLGYNVIRINNHENVDLQDYLGSFQPDPVTGELVFQYGPLVRAMKSGSWVILDELNLCSSEILESLNRLLDDNCELFIPETNEVITPQPGFALFATQNPSGLVNGTFYGGRKRLSEAFKNRFVVLEVAEISVHELKFILSHRQRSRDLAPKFIDMLVEICQALKLRLQHTLTSFQADIISQQITLRDLFRIADRLPSSVDELGMHIFMIIGEKQRSLQLREMVFATIQRVLKIEFTEKVVQEYYDKVCASVIGLITNRDSPFGLHYNNIVFTESFRRTFAYTIVALHNSENPCLIGECGSGKTQVAELCSVLLNTKLVTVNLHKNTDVSDLVGQLRPLRNRTELQRKLEAFQQLQHDATDSGLAHFYSLWAEHVQAQLNQLFRWYDGPLVQAMQDGNFLLMDEINLASDAILERLNSVFETERQLTVAEKPNCNTITAHNDFRIISTMNPMGDFGKKELSPALRSRMTEIFVRSITSAEEIRQILGRRCGPLRIRHSSHDLVESLVLFFTTVREHIQVQNFTFSIRDVIAISDHIQNQYAGFDTISVDQLMHAIQLTFLDGLQIRCPQLDHAACLHVQNQIRNCLYYHLVGDVRQLIQDSVRVCLEKEDSGYYMNFYQRDKRVARLQEGDHFNPQVANHLLCQYNFNAPTTAYNALRCVLAITNGTSKPILLESSPGAGKTSMVQNIANILGYTIVRVNLSEHIDLSDLLGQDLPKDNEDAQSLQFQFVYGPVTRAIVDGSWLLLDELNLASQQVLEGLNSLLDHRREIYIPEVNKTFKCTARFRLFAAQNPHNQGGGRKQLPQSFINRFISIYLESLQYQDYEQIIYGLEWQNSNLKHALLEVLISTQQAVNRSFGLQGGPWEINLRDIFRVFDGAVRSGGLDDNNVFLRLLTIVFLYRYRSAEDVQQQIKIIQSALQPRGLSILGQRYPVSDLSGGVLRIGEFMLDQGKHIKEAPSLLPSDGPIAESLLFGLQNGIPVLFTTAQQNETVANRVIVALAGQLRQKLSIVSLAQSTDVTDLIGQYEQLSYVQLLNELITQLSDFFGASSCGDHDGDVSLQQAWQDVNSLVTSYPEQALSDEVIHHLFIQMQRCLFGDEKTAQLMRQANPEYAILLEEHLNQAVHTTQNRNNAMFVWKDGIVVRAITQGDWLYLQNINFCSASVLDRLNSLLERDSCFYIYEQGTKQINCVNIHKNFRIMMSYSSQFGEVSRAIRNRCLEVCLDTRQYIIQVLFGSNHHMEPRYEYQMLNQHIQAADYRILQQAEGLERQLDWTDRGDLVAQMNILYDGRVTANSLTPHAFKLLTSPAERIRQYFNIVIQENDLCMVLSIAQVVENQQFDSETLQNAFKLVGLRPPDDCTAVSQVISIVFQQLIEQCQQNAAQGSLSRQILLPMLTMSSCTQSLLKLATLVQLKQKNISMEEKDILATLLYLIGCYDGFSNSGNYSSEDVLAQIDKFYLQKDISKYAKLLLQTTMNKKYMGQQGTWEAARRKINVQNLPINEETVRVLQRYREQIEIQHVNNIISYTKHQLGQFLLFSSDASQDVLFQRAARMSNDMIRHTLVIQSIVNQFSHGAGTQYQTQLLLYDKDLLSAYITGVLCGNCTLQLRCSKAIQSHYKGMYNILNGNQRRIYRERYQVLREIITGVAAFHQLVCGSEDSLVPPTIGRDSLSIGVLLPCIAQIRQLIAVFNFHDQVDPMQFYRNQLDALRGVEQRLLIGRMALANMQVVLQSRTTDDYLEGSQAAVAVDDLLQFIRRQQESVECKLVCRPRDDSEYFYALQERLHNCNIELIDQLYKVLSQEQSVAPKLVRQQIRQIIINLNCFTASLLDDNLELVVSYLDCTLPLVYLFSSLVFLLHIVLRLLHQKPCVCQDLILEAYYGISPPVQLRRYIAKYYPKCRRNADGYLVAWIASCGYTLKYSIFAEIAAEIQEQEIAAYIDYTNNVSPFRTRLQSKTSSDRTEDEELEQQMQLLFNDSSASIDDDLQQHLQAVKFITDIGRLLLLQYGGHQCINSATYSALHDQLTIYQNVISQEQFDDERMYLPALTLIKQEYEHIQQQTSRQTTVLSKVRSHQARRSQVCQNIYRTPYPGEVFDFQEHVSAVQAAADKLLQQFEDNNTLLLVMEQVRRYNDFEFTTKPLSGCLAILENMINGIVQWNMNAPKALQFDQTLLSIIKQKAIHWRRIELMSWNTFIDDVRAENEQLALINWPQLLLGCLTAARDELDADGVAAFRTQMRLFLFETSVGQFETRRTMLRSLVDCIESTQYAGRSCVALLLFQIVCETCGLSEYIASQITQRQRHVSQCFANQVKLFSWHERNFEYDSRKSHKAVIHILQKYNEILQEKVLAENKAFQEQDRTIQQLICDADESGIGQCAAALGVFHAGRNTYSQQSVIFKQLVHSMEDYLEIDCFDDQKLRQSVGYEAVSAQLLALRAETGIHQFLYATGQFFSRIDSKHKDIQGSDLTRLVRIVRIICVQYCQFRANACAECHNTVQSHTHQEAIERTQAIFRATKHVFWQLGYLYKAQLNPLLFSQCEELLKKPQQILHAAALLTANQLCAQLIEELLSMNKQLDPDIFSYIRHIIDNNIEYLRGCELDTTSMACSQPRIAFTVPFVEFPTLGHQKQCDIAKFATAVVGDLARVLASGYKAAQKDCQENEPQKEDKPKNGIGLGEAKAEQDITEQVREEDLSEDALLGNDRDESTKQDEDNDENGGGISMERDFEGALHDADQGAEEGEDADDSEVNDDMQDEQLSNGEDEDRRQADQGTHEDADNENQQGNRQQELAAGKEESQEQQDHSAQQEKPENIPEQFPEYEDVADNMNDFEEVREQDAQDISMQSENADDINMSQIFDEVFEDELMQEQNTQESEELQSFIEDTNQRFEERTELEDEQSDHAEQQKMQLEQEDVQFQQSMADDEQKQQGFAQGDRQQHGEGDEEYPETDSQTEPARERPMDSHAEDVSDEKAQTDDLKTEHAQEQFDSAVDRETINKRMEQRKELSTHQDPLPHGASDNGEELSDDETRAQANAQDAAADETAEQQLLTDRAGGEKVYNEENGNDNLEKALSAEQSSHELHGEPEESTGENIMRQLIDEIVADQMLGNQAGVLAERLKILLEPTLNSSLVGDFKSGKRLNLRKIVPFVASGYRKDRIWLRRARPQKRTYKVVLAVDNSLSVADKAIVGQIIRSLAIITRAVRLAELGRLAVCCFGERFEVLSPLGEPPGEAALFHSIVTQLHFRDRASNFRALIDGVAAIFEAESGCGPSVPAENILICLSDGQVADRAGVGEAYRELVRCHHVLPIFLLYDSTIFEQSSVRFVDINGRRTVCRMRYLEDQYPLQNYVVCAELDHLVEVLCSALVQFLQQAV